MKEMVTDLLTGVAAIAMGIVFILFIAAHMTALLP